MCRPAQIVCDTPSQPCQKRSVRFQDYTQEVRYSCGSPKAPKGASRLDEFYARNSSWRAARTLDGSMYYYNYSTHETCWERPTKDGTELTAAIGDSVEIYCEVSGTWQAGYVEKIGSVDLSIAFQMPSAAEETWVKANLHPGHMNLRGCAGACLPNVPESASVRLHATTPTFEDTELPGNWTPEELDSYNRFWKEVAGGAEETTDAEKLTANFDRSGLQQHVVNEILQVANPDLKQSLGAEEFRVCCRLIAHCQAFLSASEDPSVARAMKKGGHRLRSLLRNECLRTPAPRYPEFVA